MKTNYNITVLLCLLLSIYTFSSQAQTWQNLGNPEVGGQPIDNMYSIEGHTSGVYFCTDRGLFKSTDGGATFTNLTWESGITAGLPILCLFIDDSDGAMYIGGEDALFKSTNNGTTWSATALTASGTINDISKADTNLIAAYDQGFGSGGVYFSADGFATFQEPTTLPDLQMLDLLYFNNKMFLAGDAGMYSSTDEGATWGVQGTGHPVGGRYIKTVDLNGNLFSGDINGKGLFKSSDNGETWAIPDTGTFQDFCQVFDLTAGGGVILALTDGVNCNPQGIPIRYSDDDGLNWQSAMGNLPGAFYNELGKSADGSCFYVYALFDNLLYTTCDLALSVTENSLDAIKIAPNPSKGIIAISGIESGTMTLVNTQGKVLKTYKNIPVDKTIDISEFAQGLYFLNISNEGCTKTFKIIKN